jgi:hypothetical protein
MIMLDHWLLVFEDSLSNVYIPPRGLVNGLYLLLVGDTKVDHLGDGLTHFA